MTAHSVRRYLKRVREGDPLDSLHRAEEVGFGRLCAEARRCGRKWKFSNVDVFLRDAVTGAVFVCKRVDDALLALTVVRMRVPKPKKKRTSRLCRDNEL